MNLPEMHPRPISVLVVSEVRLYCEGIRRLLEGEDVHVAESAPEVETTLVEIRRQAPDVVLVDAALPGSVEVVRAIHERSPASRVVVLSGSEARGELLRFAEAVIAGYVTRAGSIADLVAAIESADRGEAVCSPRAAAALLDHVASLAADAAEPDGALTARELEILTLIDEGLSNREIAGRLFISVPTVKSHVHNILRKLGASRRGQAAARVRSSG